MICSRHSGPGAMTGLKVGAGIIDQRVQEGKKVSRRVEATFSTPSSILGSQKRNWRMETNKNQGSSKSQEKDWERPILGETGERASEKGDSKATADTPGTSDERGTAYTLSVRQLFNSHSNPRR